MNTRIWMLRALFCLSAGFAFVVARISGESAADDGLSGRGVTSIVAGIGAAALILLAIAPSGLWRRVLNPLRPLPARLNRPDPTPYPAIGRMLIGSAALAFVACLGRFYPIQQNPWDDDQSAYLLRAAEVKQLGGVPALLRSLVSGDFEEANRHPLYLAVLSVRPEFGFGKLVSAVTGLGTLLLATLLVARRHNTAVAAAFAVLLSTNYAFCFFSTRVVSEVFVVLFSGTAWLMIASVSDSLGDPSDGTDSRQSMRRVYCSYAGVGAMLGLAWLSKATGLLLLLATVLWGLLECWLNRRRNRMVGTGGAVSSRRWAGAIVCLCIAFLLVGSPLLVRNVRRFGNPFHNVNSLLLFADAYEEFDAMVAANATTASAARDYLASHSAADVARRELSGLVWELFIILRSLGPTPLDDSRVLFGAPLALLAIATMAARRRPEHRLLLIWGLMHWVVFAWYVPIAAGERFVLPLLIPLLVTAGEGLVQLWPWEKPRAARALMYVGMMWLVVWVIATYAGTSLLVPRLS